MSLHQNCSRSFFHEGFKINRAALLLQLLIDSTGQKYRLQWEERQKAKFIPDVSKAKRSYRGQQKP